jgi:hypothetical protein
MADIKLGQVWKDNDPRVGDRWLKLVEFDERYAVFQVYRVEPIGNNFSKPPQKRTRIQISRLKPTKTGYLLIYDPE